MIGLLDNGQTANKHDAYSDEAQLVSSIYRFASKKDEWFNLLLGLSNCISISDTLPSDHPYQDISERILAHLKNALTISTRLNYSAKDHTAVSELEHIPMGVGIIDSMGKILEINTQAKDIISQENDWQLNQGYLSAHHLKLSEKLEELSLSDRSFFSLPLSSNKTASTKTTSEKTALGNTTSKSGISKQASERNLHITAIPVEGNTTKPLFYFCFQVEQVNLVNPALLKQHYQLTETETLVVTTLIQEVSSQKTARRLKLKEATVRGHLSNIYLKFEVKRKPELIRKVLLHSLLDSPESLPSKQEDFKAHERLSAIYLRDGRKLSYMDLKASAPDNAKPACDTIETTILLLHNLMGSGYEFPQKSKYLLTDNKLRFIVPERPGYGDSDAHPKRNHRDWCHDIETLLDTLKVDKVKVIAHSVGGVYALALAEFLPHRIERIAMVNAVPRLQDLQQAKPVPIIVSAVLQSIRFAPFLIEPILKMAIGKSIEQFYEQQLNFIRPTLEGRAADINLLKTQVYRDYSLLNLKQSAKQGVGIWASELRLSFSEWDFKVTNKQMQYQFWHGDHDDVISIKAAIRLSKELNTQSFHHLREETHFLFARHFNRVVEKLIAVNPSTYSADIIGDTHNLSTN